MDLFLKDLTLENTLEEKNVLEEFKERYEKDIDISILNEFSLSLEYFEKVEEVLLQAGFSNREDIIEKVSLHLKTNLKKTLLREFNLFLEENKISKIENHYNL